MHCGMLCPSDVDRGQPRWPLASYHCSCPAIALFLWLFTSCHHSFPAIEHFLLRLVSYAHSFLAAAQFPSPLTSGLYPGPVFTPQASTRTVKGPELTSDTSIIAPKTPVST